MARGFAGPGGLVGRALTAADAAPLTALSDEAGWNQTRRDWTIMLALGSGFAYFDGARPVASALALPYARVGAAPPTGFVSMVLTTASWQRRGLARTLTARCVDALDAAGCVPGLDATPAGRAVYRTIGFSDAFALDRWRADAAKRVGAPPPPGVSLRPIGLIDAAMVALDAASIGAARPSILRELKARRPDLAWAAWRDGAVVGLAFGRDGRTAAQIGPVVAATPGIAVALISRALDAVGGAAIVDLLRGQDEAGALLSAAGLAPVREFTRMFRGAAPTVSGLLVAAAGPELA
ncbi:MAG: hypothetical protein JNL66_09310 [Alphaproteobacteria bacterium]|nr:hypothetical protein [Alphaproteobacteria bacterium]